MKNKGKILDQQISECLRKKDLKTLKVILEIDDINEQDAILDSGILNPEFLKMIMMRRDEIVLGLKDISVKENFDTKKLIKELTETSIEQAIYNSDMEGTNLVTELKAKNKQGEDVTIYYYTPSFSDDKVRNGVLRQARITNKENNIVATERTFAHSSNNSHLTDSGYYADCSYLDGSLLVFMKDKDGKNLASLYQDDIIGCRYAGYDKEGKANVIVTEDTLIHDIELDGKKYKTYEGYFDSNYTQPVLKRFEDGKTINDINPNEMIRRIETSDRVAKRRLEEEYAIEDKEVALNMIQSLNPIFKAMYSVQDIEDCNTDKMKKLVTWLENFSKRLYENPKYKSQDVGVKKAMKQAIYQTIGMRETVIDSTENSKENQREEQ